MAAPFIQLEPKGQAVSSQCWGNGAPHWRAGAKVRMVVSGRGTFFRPQGTLSTQRAPQGWSQGAGWWPHHKQLAWGSLEPRSLLLP
jgi:hypothetical protein